MSKFFAYYKETGEVLCVASKYDPPPAGMYYGEIDYRANPGSIYFDGFEFMAIPEKPGIYYRFNYTTKQWEDPRSLLQLQDTQWDLIKAMRAAYVDSPLPTPYGIFDCDPASRNSITDAVLMLQTLASIGQITSIDFTLADNTVVVLNLESMVAVGLLVGQRVQEGFAIGRLRRDVIYAATTREEIEAVVW